MSHSYVYPTIATLPLGYRANVVAPVDQIRGRLTVPDTDIGIRMTMYHDGRAEEVAARTLQFRDGSLVGSPPAALEIPDIAERGAENPGYLEIETFQPDGHPVFKSKQVVGVYTVFMGDGRASFLSDNAYKYGSPPIIAQVARFKKFVDTYPVVRVDRARGFGQSLTLINPYKMPLVANVLTEDGRKLKRRKVPAHSARYWDLSEVLADGEDRWEGQLQLTANNRVIAFTFKHDFGDQTRISDYEHLDPFREDPTHIAASIRLRQRVCGWLRKRMA